MQDAPKAVWSILYVSAAFFPSLKHNSIAYRSSKVSDIIFEIPQQWQSGFNRVDSNCCCSCSFKVEIIQISQASHKMYSNNIVNFQESTTILNACTKRSGNLLKTPRTCSLREDYLLHTFPEGIGSKWNAKSLIKDLNSGRCVYFLKMVTLTQRKPSLSLFLSSHLYIKWICVCGHRQAKQGDNFLMFLFQELKFKRLLISLLIVRREISAKKRNYSKVTPLNTNLWLSVLYESVEEISIYPTPFTRTGYDTRSIF